MIGERTPAGLCAGALVRQLPERARLAVANFGQCNDQQQSTNNE